MNNMSEIKYSSIKFCDLTLKSSHSFTWDRANDLICDPQFYYDNNKYLYASFSPQNDLYCLYRLIENRWLPIRLENIILVFQNYSLADNWLEVHVYIQYCVRPTTDSFGIEWWTHSVTFIAKTIQSKGIILCTKYGKIFNINNVIHSEVTDFP